MLLESEATIFSWPISTSQCLARMGPLDLQAKFESLSRSYIRMAPYYFEQI